MSSGYLLDSGIWFICPFHELVFFSILTRGYVLNLERDGGRETDREREIDRFPPSCTPSEDQNLTHPNQGSNPHLNMCPDQESNPQPFGVRNDSPTNWATHPAPMNMFFNSHQLGSVSFLFPDAILIHQLLFRSPFVFVGLFTDLLTCPLCCLCGPHAISHPWSTVSELILSPSPLLAVGWSGTDLCLLKNHSATSSRL